MSETACSFCEEPAEHTCPTCGRLYCAQHGDDTCTSCMSPESALPSGAVYVGSIVALLAATVVGVFLMLNPPAEETRADAPREITPPAATEPTATATPTPDPNAPATPTTPGGTATPSGEPTTTPAAGDGGDRPDAPPGTEVYSVVQGDTLSGIAVEFDTEIDVLLELNPDLDVNTPLQIGQEIFVPANE